MSNSHSLHMSPEQLAAYQERQRTARIVSPKADKLEQDAEEARIRNAERLAGQGKVSGRERGETKPSPVERPHNKFRNIPTVVDGIKFDSKREAKRYGELKLMEKAGQIQDLRTHTKLSIDVNVRHIGFYESDFDYFREGKRIFEDTKGRRTAVYQLKKKLIFALYGVEIQEI